MKTYKFLFAFTIICYIAMHIYFAWYAFITFKLWVALVTTFVPVGGDVLLIGAAIGLKNWVPLFVAIIVATLYFVCTALANKADKQ